MTNLITPYKGHGFVQGPLIKPQPIKYQPRERGELEGEKLNLLVGSIIQKTFLHCGGLPEDWSPESDKWPLVDPPFGKEGTRQKEESRRFSWVFCGQGGRSHPSSLASEAYQKRVKNFRETGAVEASDLIIVTELLGVGGNAEVYAAWDAMHCDKHQVLKVHQTRTRSGAPPVSVLEEYTMLCYLSGERGPTAGLQLPPYRLVKLTTGLQGLDSEEASNTGDQPSSEERVWSVAQGVFCRLGYLGPRYTRDLAFLLEMPSYKGEFSYEILLSIFRQLTSGLCSLHKKFKIYHGDICPENVLCNWRREEGVLTMGRVDLGDFGGAKRFEDIRSLLLSNQPPGKVVASIKTSFRDAYCKDDDFQEIKEQIKSFRCEELSFGELTNLVLDRLQAHDIFALGRSLSACLLLEKEREPLHSGEPSSLLIREGGSQQKESPEQRDSVQKVGDDWDPSQKLEGVLGDQESLWGGGAPSLGELHPMLEALQEGTPRQRMEALKRLHDHLKEMSRGLF